MKKLIKYNWHVFFALVTSGVIVITLCFTLTNHIDNFATAMMLSVGSSLPLISIPFAVLDLEKHFFGNNV